MKKIFFLLFFFLYFESLCAENNFAYINIKYYGKINKIKEKLIEKGIDINFKNNKWSARLK